MIRQTSQRAAVEQSFRESARPLSTAELLAASRRRVPSINLATVYRTLKRLIETGVIRAVALPGEPDRYELTGLKHHHHFRCDRCERVFDVAGSCPVGVNMGLPAGFAVREHEVVLYGTCADCGQGSGHGPAGRGSIRKASRRA